MALFGLLCVAISFAGMFLMHNPALHNPALHEAAGVHPAIAGIDLFFACVYAFCLWTVVGLFRLRRWARYSAIVIGILIFTICGLLSALMFVLPHFARTAGKAAVSHAQLSLILTILIVIGIFYAATALIGLWLVVYFNLKRVRSAFATGGAALTEDQISADSEYNLWRGVVIAFACLMLAGSVFLLGMAWLRLPFMLFGMIFRGNSACIIALVFAAIQLFVGVGLLVRLRSAYWTAVGWQVFSVLSMALLLVPSYAARTLALGNEFSRRWMPFQMNAQINSTMGSAGFLSMQQHWLVMAGIGGIAMFLIFAYALFRCRRWYLGDDPMSTLYK